MLVNISTNTYRVWISQHLDEPLNRQLALDALDAYDGIESRGSASEQEVNAIVAAASCRFVRVWEIGADLLFRLAARHQETRNAIHKMLRDSKAGIRFQAIAFLGHSRVPGDFAASLIRQGLQDRSHRVRGRVADAACQLGLTDLLEELDAARDRESHAVTRKSLEFAIALLRTGYLLVRNDGKLTSIWVRLDGDRGWCCSVPISDEDLRAGKLEEIIASARGI